MKTKSTLTNQLLSNFTKTTEGMFILHLKDLIKTSSSFFTEKHSALNIVSSLLLSVLSGRLVMNLIRELLTFLNLDCTLSVFDAEAIEGRGLQVFIV